MDFKYYFEMGKNFGDFFYFKNENKFKYIKWVFVALVVAAFIGLVMKSVSASALTTSTYDDLTANSNTVQNLLSLIPDEAYSDDYVVFSDNDYSYYCFYGDLKSENNKITGSDLKYIHYFRQGSGYNYNYFFGTDTLDLSVSDVVTSNMNIEKASNSWNFDNWKDTKITKICCLAFIPIILFANLWGCVKHDFI